MPELNSTELAAALSVSKPRISQYVSEGKLDGCYTGEGRSRRFDLAMVAKKLGRNLHPGQMMGNGSETRASLREIGASTGSDAGGAAEEFAPQKKPRSDTVLPETDTDRYELARIQKAEEEARRLRRLNMAEEGRWVRADEVERQTARAMSQELSRLESMIRDAARAVADQFGQDFRSVRRVMMDEYRRYRADQSEEIGARAGATGLSDVEEEDDF